MKKILSSILILSVLFLLSGCYDSVPIQDSAMPLISSYDLKDNGQVAITGVFYSSTEQDEVTENILTISASTVEQARYMQRAFSFEEWSPALLTTVLFGYDIAKRGIWSVVDNMVRDPAMNSSLQMAVCLENAEELLKNEKIKEVNKFKYIENLLASASKENGMLQKTLSDFYDDYNTPGVNSILPVVGINENDNLKIIGWGYMNNDKLVDVVEVAESAAINLCIPGNGSGVLTFNVFLQQENKEVTLSAPYSSSTKVSAIQTEDDSFEFFVDISLDVRVTEIFYKEQINITSSQTVDQIRTAITGIVKEKVDKMIKYNHKELKQNNYNYALAALACNRKLGENLVLKSDFWNNVKVNVKVEAFISAIL